MLRKAPADPGLEAHQIVDSSEGRQVRKLVVGFIRVVVHNIQDNLA
jgi:hypothetical protein